MIVVKIRFKYALLALALTIFPYKVFCQDGTVPFLGIIPDARTAGMAGAGVALGGDAFSVFRNAAQISLTEAKAEAAYSFSPYMRELDSKTRFHSAAGFYRINRKHAVAAGFRNYTLGKSRLTDDDGNILRNAKPRDMSFDLAYSYSIFDNFSVALTARYIDSDLGVASGDAFAFDLGIGYRYQASAEAKSFWSFGFRAANIGTDVDYGNGKYSLPATLEAGAGYGKHFNRSHLLFVSASFDYRRPFSDDGSFRGAVGAEYTYKDFLTARCGFSVSDIDDSSLFSTGLGVNTKYVYLNASYWIAGKENPLRGTWHLTLGTRFGR